MSAAQRVLTREKISAGIGSWLSSFTLGVTEVAERLQVPWLTLSYADSITERGFKYTFQTSPVSSLQAEQALELVTDLAKKNNRPIKKAAIVGDNTAATVFFFKPLREKLLAAKGIELVVDEVWTPPAGRRHRHRAEAPLAPSPTSSSTAPPTSRTRSRSCRRSRSSA